MYTDEFLNLMCRAMRRHASQSPTHAAWVITIAHFEYVFLVEGHYLPPRFASLQEALEQGAKRGLWEMDLDQDQETDVVVLK
ncbi:hypothetical protein [Dyella mobilis]|uniref:Uncharacterized protein n=1 Tax=Dyella mobilis TaxID=1849582 RepID=A0ABS2KC06_9GAMM|nr:hypothetical protein [Dyella mobilis]MBM7128706.1 hypothetical protein [Dyella mobilis]GLQ99031.1 hypothetical protein GCM10007863_34510 [Dyella mobilis]